MKTMTLAILAAAIAFATPAAAEYQTVQTRAEFVALVSGKTLIRPLVRLEVRPDGNISGKGAAWEVSGKWQWKDGFLCRSLVWGGDDLGYNCQQVKAKGSRMRITSDRGTGQSAEFRLR